MESGNIATLPEDWQWPALEGRAYGRGDLEGPLEDLAFDGWVSVYDFRLGEVAARYGEAALSMRDVLEEMDITGGIEGEGFELGGVPLGQYLLWGSVNERSAQVDSFRSDLGDTSVVLHFAGDFSDSLSSFVVPDFRVDLEGTRWALSDTLRFAVGPGIFRLAGGRAGLGSGADPLRGRLRCRRQRHRSHDPRGLRSGPAEPLLRDAHPPAQAGSRPMWGWPARRMTRWWS